MNGLISILWAGMIVASIGWAMATESVQALSEGVLEAAAEAVDLCIYMGGIVCFWTGMMEAAKEAGILDQIEKWMLPVLRFLFPKLENERARRYMAANMTANILGLGWAATPSGLMAMEELQLCKEDPEDYASDEMCTFLVLNISSLQLIPITIIGYRSQYGSVDPAGITGPAIIATAASTLAAVIFCKFMCRRKK